MHSELEEFGTAAQNQRLDGDQIAIAQRALRATLVRHGINRISRGETSAGSGPTGSTEVPRGLGAGRHAATSSASSSGPFSLNSTVWKTPPSRRPSPRVCHPRAGTGWPAVDAALDDVRVRFRSAVTSADYQDVGRRCVAVMEALSGTVYDPAKHLGRRDRAAGR